MIRLLFVALALALLATAGYLQLRPSASYSHYSRDELAQFEAQLRADSRVDDAELRIGMIEDELRRRWAVPTLGVAALALLAAAVLVRSGGSGGSRGEDDEAQRLMAAIGSPEQALGSARRKAAALLGVALEAPPTVIEAALDAQLRERGPEVVAGLPEDLRRAAEQRRDELIRARDLLVGKRSTPEA